MIGEGQELKENQMHKASKGTVDEVLKKRDVRKYILKPVGL